MALPGQPPPPDFHPSERWGTPRPLNVGWRWPAGAPPPRALPLR